MEQFCKEFCKPEVPFPGSSCRLKTVKSTKESGMGGTVSRKRGRRKEYFPSLKNWEQTSITLSKELFKARNCQVVAVSAGLRSTTTLRLAMGSTVPQGQFSTSQSCPAPLVFCYESEGLVVCYTSSGILCFTCLQHALKLFILLVSAQPNPHPSVLEWCMCSACVVLYASKPDPSSMDI